MSREKDRNKALDRRVLYLVKLCAVTGITRHDIAWVMFGDTLTDNHSIGNSLQRLRRQGYITLDRHSNRWVVN